MREKRRWAWKEKHVRKHRFQEAWLHRFYRYGVPKWYKKHFHRQNRVKERVDLINLEKGKQVECITKTRHNSDNWMYY